MFVPSKWVHLGGAAGLLSLYLYYIKLKFAESDEDSDSENGLEPLFFARTAKIPSYGWIGVQGLVGLAGLALGAHLFVTAAEHASFLCSRVDSGSLMRRGTELPECNSFSGSTEKIVWRSDVPGLSPGTTPLGRADRTDGRWSVGCDDAGVGDSGSRSFCFRRRGWALATLLLMCSALFYIGYASIYGW